MFIPEWNVESLKYAFYDFDDNELLYEELLKNIGEDEQISVTWSGVDRNDIPVASGWCYLSIRVNFEPTSDSPQGSTVTGNFRFFHKSSFIHQRLNTEN